MLLNSEIRFNSLSPYFCLKNSKYQSPPLVCKTIDPGEPRMLWKGGKHGFQWDGWIGVTKCLSVRNHGGTGCLPDPSSHTCGEINPALGSLSKKGHPHCSEGWVMIPIIRFFNHRSGCQLIKHVNVHVRVCREGYFESESFTVTMTLVFTGSKF